MQTAKALLRLTRPDSTILAFLAVFLPLAAETDDMVGSLAVSLPVLLIAMCTFILNDIDDVESDKINHPERPLPSGRVLVRLVTATYFLCLALALFTTKIFVPNGVSFLYYGLLVLSINYRYAAEHFANYKAVYVALASTFPVFIVVNLLQDASRLYLVAFATFFFVLGRELLSDFMDQAGDPDSFIKRIPWRHLTTVAFSLEVIALVILLCLVQDAADILAIGLITTLSPLSLFLWSKGRMPGPATVVMKVQMYGGLYFLFE